MCWPQKALFDCLLLQLAAAQSMFCSVSANQAGELVVFFTGECCKLVFDFLLVPFISIVEADSLKAALLQRSGCLFQVLQFEVQMDDLQPRSGGVGARALSFTQPVASGECTTGF